MKRFVSEVVLCFDADTAGRKAAERSLDPLLQNNLIVRVAEMPPGEDPDSMIRHLGKDEFEKRVAAAPDFFDSWIEHETASTDLDSLGAKMQLARRLAETVAQIRDSLLRGQVVNKVSSRLGVPRSDFEQLLTKPNRERVLGEDPPGGTATPPPRREIAMFCLLAASSRSAGISPGATWRETLAQTGCGNVSLILELIASDDPASISAFMAGLSPGDEALVSSWLSKRCRRTGSRSPKAGGMGCARPFCDANSRSRKAG